MHTKLFKKYWGFSTEAPDALTTGTEEVVGQPTSVIYICGLLETRLAKFGPFSLKRLNENVGASWIVELAYHACTLTMLDEQN